MRVAFARSKPAFSAKAGRKGYSPEVTVEANCLPSRSFGVLIGPSFNTPMPIVASYAQAASATVGSPLMGLRDRSRRRGHAEIEPGLADRLCGGDRARSAGDLDIEPMLLPESHALGDKGEQIAALGNPGQGELDPFPVLGEDEARSGDAAGGDA